MNRFFIPGLALLCTVLGLQSCYYDVESELYPVDPNFVCDTTAVTYAATIQPIIQTNCYSCHSVSAGPNNGNIVLEGHSNIQSLATSGKLYGVVSHTAGSPMPKNGNKLPDCDIAKIKKWADSGAPNN